MVAVVAPTPDAARVEVKAATVRSMPMTPKQRKHLAEAENKKTMGNDHYKRHAFTHENEDMRWAVRRYTEALRELDTLTGTPLLDKKGWTPTMANQAPDEPVEPADEAGDGDEDILELGADGTFDAVTFDKAKPAPKAGEPEPPLSEPPAVVTVPVGQDTANPHEVELEDLDETQLAARVLELRISCLLNRAQAHLRCKGYGGNDGAEKDCTTVLQQLDVKNAKAYFRRGQARHSMRRFEGAAEDLQRAHKLVPKDNKVGKALKEAKLALEAQEKSKKLWNPSEEARRKKAAEDEQEVIVRLTSADNAARKEYGAEKWEKMSDTEKRQIVIDFAVREELEKTAPKTAMRFDGDMSLGTDAGDRMDAARSAAREKVVAAAKAAEPEPEPAPPVEDSWGAFWEDDKVAERDAKEKLRSEAAKRLEAAAEVAMREKFSVAQKKMRAEDEATAEASRKARRENLQNVAAAQRKAALAAAAGKPMTSKDDGTPTLKGGFFGAAPVKSEPAPALAVPAPEPELQPAQLAAAATLTAALAGAAGGGSSSSGGGADSTQVWEHCAVPPLHKCRAHYGRKWTSMPSETKRLAITAAEQGTDWPA